MEKSLKNREWTEEEKQNVVNVFSWLLEQDKKQNPHLYKKIKNPPKSIENIPDNSETRVSL